jgi:hypothetical protein
MKFKIGGKVRLINNTEDGLTFPDGIVGTIVCGSSGTFGVDFHQEISNEDRIITHRLKNRLSKPTGWFCYSNNLRPASYTKILNDLNDEVKQCV